MKRTKDKIIEPTDSTSAIQQAKKIFLEAGWCREYIDWIPELCLSLLQREDKADAELDHLAEHRLGVLASSWHDASEDRDRALLMVYVRLCGCGGKHAQFGHPVRSQGDDIEWELPQSSRDGVAEKFRSRGANFEAALITGGWPGNYGSEAELGGILLKYVELGTDPQPETPEIVRLMQFLVDDAHIDLGAVVDEGGLVARGSRRLRPDSSDPMSLRVPEKFDCKHGPFNDPRDLSNWMIGIGPRAISHLFSRFKRWPDDRYGTAMAMGLRDAIERWLYYRTSHWTYFRKAGPDLAEYCKPYLSELETHCSAHNQGVNCEVRRAWLWFALCVYEAKPNLWHSLSHERREVVLRAANEDVAALRKIFSRAVPKPVKDEQQRELLFRNAAQAGIQSPAPRTPAELSQDLERLLPQETDGPIEGKMLAPWEEFEWERDHFNTCVTLLYQFGGVWRGMKPMLLALRSLTTPAVACDLRYWTEYDRPNPPEPWSCIPMLMINPFHAYIGREQSTDPELVGLRGNLATFCLERLVDRWSKKERDSAADTGRLRSNDDMLERSPEWRICLIRAVTSLGVNPEGKGHRVLHTSSRIDPDDDVRETARQAYEQLRRGISLPEGVSPRRAIMSALWWIRQAHLLGLGIQLDPDGAQRTRIKELTRTKEVERDDNPVA